MIPALILAATVAGTMPGRVVSGYDIRTGVYTTYAEPAGIAKLRTYYGVVRPGQSTAMRLVMSLNWSPPGRVDNRRITHMRPWWIAQGDSFLVQWSVCDSLGRWDDARAAFRAR